MSTLNSLHISVPQSNPFNPYSHRNSRSSLSSNGSPNSPLSPPNDGNWVPNEVDYGNRRSAKRGVSTFISELFSMASDRRNQHLISWNPIGSSFLVCNATRFAQEVLPKHFKHSNFSSFVRQLNMYGFHKINKSPRGQRGNNENEIWEFSHPKFQRGRPDILKDIKRKAMDSELLRRETGDIHVSFAMVQLSQADLLQQFRVLQEDFASLLQGFEEMKKVQLQQQIITRRLAERQGLPTNNNLSPLDYNDQPSVFVTSPSTSAGEPLNHWDQPQPQPQQPQMMMPSMYQNSNPQDFTLPMNPPPPSPVSSVLLSSPSSSSDDQATAENYQKRRMSSGHGMSLSFPDH